MIRTIWTSIRKPSMYNQLTQMSLVRAIFSLLLFFILATGVDGWKIAVDTNRVTNFLQQDFKTKMPPFTYDGTVLEAEQTEPITLSQDNGFKVILDTTTPDARGSLRQVANGIVLGKTDMYYIANGVEQSVSYRQLQMPALTKDDLLPIIPIIKPMMIVLLIIWFVATLIWRFLEIFFFSFLAKLFASMQNIRLSYRQAWMAAGFALIPATLINLLNTYLVSVYLTYAFWVAIVTYLYHGVGSFKDHRLERGE